MKRKQALLRRSSLRLSSEGKIGVQNHGEERDGIAESPRKVSAEEKVLDLGAASLMEQNHMLDNCDNKVTRACTTITPIKTTTDYKSANLVLPQRHSDGCLNGWNYLTDSSELSSEDLSLSDEPFTKKMFLSKTKKDEAVASEDKGGTVPGNSHIHNGMLCFAQVFNHPYWPAIIFANHDKNKINAHYFVAGNRSDDIPFDQILPFSTKEALLATLTEKKMLTKAKEVKYNGSQWSRAHALCSRAERLPVKDRIKKFEESSRQFLKGEEPKERKRHITGIPIQLASKKKAKLETTPRSAPTLSKSGRLLKPALSVPTSFSGSHKKQKLKAVKDLAYALALNKKHKKNDKSSSDTDESSLPSTSSKDSKTSQDGKKRHKTVNYVNLMSAVWDEDVCFVCEDIGEQENMIRCKGSCERTYHFDCLGVSQGEENYKCDTCAQNQSECFICHKTEGDKIPCATAKCCKSYHKECLKREPYYSFDEASEKLTCPLHVCATCSSYNIRPYAKKGPFLPCMYCPTAYHSSDHCIPAGTEIVNKKRVICCSHWDQKKSHTPKQRHVDICFLCDQGAQNGSTLICCEVCTIAFHFSCAQVGEEPSEEFRCEACINKRRHLYGQILWVKHGAYRYTYNEGATGTRWWPALAVHPKEVPETVNSVYFKKRSVGDFIVLFLGWPSSDGYAITNIHNAYEFIDGDEKSSKGCSSNLLVQRFKDGVALGSRMLKEFNAKRMEWATNVNTSSYTSYKSISVNKTFNSALVVSKTVDMDTYPQCCCAEEKACDSDDCINRTSFVECHYRLCKAEKQCKNRRLQNREYVKHKIIKVPGKGWGLFAQEDVGEGRLVGEYVGEIVDNTEYKKRLERKNREGECHFYFMSLDSQRIIDAEPLGNVFRFMNHSCDPNCEVQKWTVGNDTRNAIVAIKAIKCGEELTFNYDLSYIITAESKLVCKCGSKLCTGFIGGGKDPKPLDAKNSANTKTAKKTKKPRKKYAQRQRPCFKCKELSDTAVKMILCARKSCNKAYHPTCVNVDNRAEADWICPQHNSDVPKRIAKKNCQSDNNECAQQAPGFPEGDTRDSRSDGESQPEQELLDFNHELDGSTDKLNLNLASNRSPLVDFVDVVKSPGKTRDSRAEDQSDSGSSVENHGEKALTQVKSKRRVTRSGL